MKYLLKELSWKIYFMKNGMFNTKIKLYLFKKDYFYEYIKYSLLGSINFIICHIIYIFFCNYLNINYKLSYTICNFISAFLSYVFNLRITFNQKSFKIKDLVKVYLSHLIEYICNILLITVLVELLKISELIAPLITPVITTPLAFILVRKSIKKRA